MFCRKCGKSLIDGDRFCPYCGAQVIERKQAKEQDKKEEEIVYNVDNNERHFFSETLKPKWNLDAFPNTEEEPKKTEDILVDWQKNMLIKPTFNPDKDMSFSQQLQAFDSSFDVSKKEIEEREEKRGAEPVKSTLIFERVKPIEPIIAPVGSEPILNVEAEEKEKFFTFSQKNAEFQRLLDKEYEKIKAIKEETVKEIQNADAKTETEPKTETDAKTATEPKTETDAKTETEPKTETDAKTETEPKTETDAKTATEPKTESDAKTTTELDMQWEQQLPPFEDEKTEKKLSLVTIILGVIVLLVGISVAALAIEQFMPNSVAGKTVHTYLEKGRDFFRENSA